jgi:hypothetical protein
MPNVMAKLDSEDVSTRRFVVAGSEDEEESPAVLDKKALLKRITDFYK